MINTFEILEDNMQNFLEKAANMYDKKIVEGHQTIYHRNFSNYNNTLDTKQKISHMLTTKSFGHHNLRHKNHDSFSM